MNPAQVELRRARVGLQPCGGLVMLPGLGQPPLLLQHPAQRDVRGGFFRGDQGQHAFPARDRLAGLIPLALKLGKLFPARRVLRRQRDGHLQPRQGLIEPALVFQAEADLEMRRRPSSIEPQRLEIGGSRVDVPRPRLERLAQTMIEQGQDGIAQRFDGALAAGRRRRRGNGPLGINPEGFLLGGHGLGLAAETAQCPGEIMVQDRHRGLQADRFPQRPQRLLGPALLEQRQAEVGVHAEDARVERDRLAERGDRLAGAPQLAADHAQVVVRREKPGLSLRGVAEVRDGLLAPAQALEGQAECIERFGIVRPELQRHPAAAGRPHSVPQVAECFGQVDMDGRGARSEGCGPAEQLGRSRVFTALGMLSAKGVQGGGSGWLVPIAIGQCAGVISLDGLTQTQVP